MAWGSWVLLIVSVAAYGDGLEDAARGLGKTVGAHLAGDETAHVTVRNLSAMGRADMIRAQAAFEQVLRRRVRNPNQVEINLTVSENLKGYLLVAELRRGTDRIVEMEGYRPERASAQARAAVTIEKRLLWEQDAPILDVAVTGDAVLVLDTSGVTRHPGGERVDLTVMSRDPRGRLEIAGDSLIVHLPGSTCRGTVAALSCETGGVLPAVREAQYFSREKIGDAEMVAELDGRTRFYDGTGKVTAVVEDWGSDVAAICDGRRLLATSDKAPNDFVTAYEIVNGAPVRVSEPLEFPGPLTALWPGVAIARNQATGKYAAYALTVDCGR